MSTTASKLNITKVGRVCVTIADTDRALDFYTGTLGFEKVVDEPMGPDMRWVEVAVSGAETTFSKPSVRSEEHTSELQSPCNLVCRLLLEKKNNILRTRIDIVRPYCR